MMIWGFPGVWGMRWEKYRLETGIKRGSKIMEVPVCYPSQFHDQWEATKKCLSRRATE